MRVHQLVYAWQPQFSDFVSYQVILSILNQGDGWAEVSGFNSDYQVLSPTGSVVATGSFSYEYPRFIGPAETGYLITDGFEQGVTPEDFATMEASGRYDPVDGPDVTFTFEELTLVKHPFDLGYTATGFVSADRDVTDAAIAVVCLATDGTPLGATWTNLVQNITAGQRKGFETVSTSPPLDPSQCAGLPGLAEDTGF